MNKRSTISYDYIRGLIEGEGSFTFSSTGKRKVPAFAIRMHVRDKKLIEEIKNVLKLKNKIYEYDYQKNDGYKRGPQALLVVREFGQLKNIIIPFFYKKLYGNKADQFEQWIEKIGKDPLVSDGFKFLHMLYKSGFYDKEESIKMFE